MKRTYLNLIIILFHLPCFAQFKLSGRVLNNKTADTLYLNIPYVYGYESSNSIIIPVNNKGEFRADINLKEQKFAIIKYHGVKTTLLLKPGKNLKLNFDVIGNSITNFNGTSAVENQLLSKLELDNPAFFYAGDNANAYKTLNAAEVPVKIYQPLIDERDKRLALVNASTLTPADKKLIAQEVRAQAINLMCDYTRAFWKPTSKADYYTLIEIIFKANPPKAQAQPAGPRFYAFANQYIAYLEQQALVEYQLRPDQDRDKAPLKYYGLTIDSLKKTGREKGKLYVNWQAAKNGMDRVVAEPLLAQYIFVKTEEKLLYEAAALLDEMKSNYPNSRYLHNLNKRVEVLKLDLARNAVNAEIQIVKGYEKIASIYDVVKQFKGKVVYLDVWGTWCGPCKDELKYNPLLKAHFKDKDVAFVYLDMDPDEKDSQWRDFLKVNNLAGMHLRKSNTDIQSFWKELLPNKPMQQQYPTYFIFDKAGKLVVAEAKRPSDKAELYTQIEKYL